MTSMRVRIERRMETLGQLPPANQHEPADDQSHRATGQTVAPKQRPQDLAGLVGVDALPRDFAITPSHLESAVDLAHRYGCTLVERRATELLHPL